LYAHVRKELGIDEGSIDDAKPVFGHQQ
jgi:hypothetical protein